MEENRKPQEWTIEEMSKDILRQRNKLDVESKQMSDDIAYFIVKYFNDTNAKVYFFDNFFKTKTKEGRNVTISAIEYDTISSTIYLVLVTSDHRTDIKIWLTDLFPMEQAELFDYFVAEIKRNSVYVIVEEIFDQETKIDILTTFKNADTAKRFLSNRVTQQKTALNPHIWEQASREGIFERCDNTYINEENHYYFCTREHYYDIKIVPQIVL